MQKLKNTNTNEYKTEIFQYLLEAIDSSGYDKELTTDKEKINFVFDCFNSEFNYHNNVLRYPNAQERLKEWLMGLPSCIGIVYTNYDILELTKKLHEVNELTTKQEDTILMNYFNHIALKLIQLKIKLNK